MFHEIKDPKHPLHYWFFLLPWSKLKWFNNYISIPTNFHLANVHVTDEFIPCGIPKKF